VDAAGQQALIQAADLEKTSMAMAVDALLVQRDKHWSALLPLTALADKDINADSIRSAMSAANLPKVLFMDMKAESDRLYSGYLNEAIVLSLAGLGVIVVLLLVVFRSGMRAARVIAPLLAAVITVTAGLALWGQQLMILHLVGLLLVAAVGSNYALFFDQTDADSKITPSTLASMLFANLTTVAGFGLLAFSNVSILQAMGVTVAPGVVLALIYAAIFARTSRV
jgi:predicted exporter